MCCLWGVFISLFTVDSGSSLTGTTGETDGCRVPHRTPLSLICGRGSPSSFSSRKAGNLTPHILPLWQIALHIDAVPNKRVDDTLLSLCPIKPSWAELSMGMQWTDMGFILCVHCLRLPWQRRLWMAAWGLTLVVWPQSALRAPSCWESMVSVYFLLLPFLWQFLPAQTVISAWNECLSLSACVDL